MNQAVSEPLERRSYEAAWLMSTHPPRLRSANKRVVFEVACPAGRTHGGTIGYARWREMRLPERVDVARAVKLLEPRVGFYDYAPAAGSGSTVEWHVNFADESLFFGYGSDLFAQDEIQAAEHPALGALREALLAEGLRAVTAERGRPTPVTVMGVERRCAVATEPDAAAGRPVSLYGRTFGRAPAEVVRRATRRIEPPTITNLVAMAAPGYGSGRYTAQEIEDILTTAYTGFRACALESRRALGADAGVIVHTGFWGCGAFGGNRTMMTLLQALAAAMAGLDKLVYHVGAEPNLRTVAKARALLETALPAGAPLAVADVVERCAALGLRWGESDGN